MAGAIKHVHVSMSMCQCPCVNVHVSMCPGRKPDVFSCLQILLRSLKLPCKSFEDQITRTRFCWLWIKLLPVDGLRCHQYNHGPSVSCIEVEVSSN